MKRTSDGENIVTINKVVQATLSQRYKLCDQDGHRTPDTKANYCNYCYRHLNYNGLDNDLQSKDLSDGLAKIVKELNIV